MDTLGPMLHDSGARPLVIGHRGASGYRPEHTRSAYELAFALGADAVEPDIVATRDGVLVLRHENEISGTTDVATRPEFASRRTTREVDGKPLTGWFTEDFTWAELSTLRARERLGALRQSSASFDDRYPVIRLRDLFELIDTAADEQRRLVRMVAEFKHASHFAALGLPLDELFAAELDDAGWGRGDERLVMEAFELDVLDRLGIRGIRGPRVFLVEATGSPVDVVLAMGAAAPSYDDYMTEAGLLGLAGRVDGVSVDKARLLGAPRGGANTAAASERGAVGRSPAQGRAARRRRARRCRALGRAPGVHVDAASREPLPLVGVPARHGSLGVRRLARRVRARHRDRRRRDLRRPPRPRRRGASRAARLNAARRHPLTAAVARCDRGDARDDPRDDGVAVGCRA